VPFPPLVYLGTAGDAAPLLVAAISRRPVRGARAWILAWCATALVTGWVSLVLASQGRHNLWLSYLYTPLSTGLVLWALSCWQPGETARLTVRLAIAPVLILWAVLTVAFDSTSTFSRAAEPMVNLVCLGAAAFTLLARSLRARGDLLHQDWLWITAGLALYFGTWSLLIPLSGLLMGAAVPLLRRAYEMQAVFEAVAMLAIARGIACPPAA
jgi:hypothetical protein